MQTTTFEKALELVQGKDRRYRREAYIFVREALALTHTAFAQAGGARLRQFTGRDLLTGLRELALVQFGPMAITVLEEWGIRSCRDFGEIICNLVQSGVVAGSEVDWRADFAKGFDFDEAFRQPFLPPSKQANAKGVPGGSPERN